MIKSILKISIVIYVISLTFNISNSISCAIVVEEKEDSNTSAAMAAITHQAPKQAIKMTQHDAFLYFCSVGHKEAVPELIKALSEVKIIETEYQGKKINSYVCTWGHLRKALIAQTGKDYGVDQAAWQKWWDTEGKDLPENYFSPENHKVEIRK